MSTLSQKQTLKDPLDVLVVAAHPDDAEISVGGSIIAHAEQGLRVGIIDLTSGEPTPYGSEEIRAAETNAANKPLKICWRENLQLPNRSLQNDLDAREALASIFRLTRPKIILAPYWEDIHPDHVAASQLADDARFWSKLTKTQMPGDPFWPAKIYYYWSLHLRIHPKPAMVLDISSQIEKKMEAVQCYQSQLIKGRSEAFPTIIDDIRDRARYWGWTIGKAYGEPLASREEIGLTSLENLVND